MVLEYPLAEKEFIKKEDLIEKALILSERVNGSFRHRCDHEYLHPLRLRRCQGGDDSHGGTERCKSRTEQDLTLKGDWNMGLFEIFKKKSESEVKPTCDELYPHEVQAIAEKRVEVIMAGLLEKNPEPDKETDTMALVRHMNLLKEMAEEVVVREVIYE